MNQPPKPARFRGIRVHDNQPDTWLHKQADLPQNPANVAKAAQADVDAPSEGPDIRNQVKRFGQNVNNPIGGINGNS